MGSSLVRTRFVVPLTQPVFESDSGHFPTPSLPFPDISMTIPIIKWGQKPPDCSYYTKNISTEFPNNLSVATKLNIYKLVSVRIFTWHQINTNVLGYVHLMSMLEACGNESLFK